MRYITFFVLLSFSYSAIKAQLNQTHGSKMQEPDQAVQIAIHDFSKTKLFKKDSVFVVTLYDTLYHVAYDTISKNNYRSKRGRAYPNIIAVDILGYPYKYFLDTTVDLNNQKGIPSRFIEKNGKLFIGWGTHDRLTDSTIKLLDKYNLIGRSGHDDWYKFIPGIDDAKQAAQYYFCRSNLYLYKKKITSAAIGYYDPPTLTCEQ